MLLKLSMEWHWLDQIQDNPKLSSNECTSLSHRSVHTNISYNFQHSWNIKSETLGDAKFRSDIFPIHWAPYTLGL